MQKSVLFEANEKRVATAVVNVKLDMEIRKQCYMTREHSPVAGTQNTVLLPSAFGLVMWRSRRRFQQERFIPFHWNSSVWHNHKIQKFFIVSVCFSSKLCMASKNKSWC